MTTPIEIIIYLVAQPTNRKWAITPVLSGLTLLITNHWGYNPLTIRG